MTDLQSLHYHINTCHECFESETWQDMCEDGLILYLEAKKKYGDIAIKRLPTGMLEVK